jgi:tRNA-dihydrouridine synthase 1
VRHFVEHQGCVKVLYLFIFIIHTRELIIILHNSARRPWYKHFRAALNRTHTIEEIETLLKVKVVRWRGKAGAVISNLGGDGESEDEKETGKDDDDGLGDLALIR